MTARRLRFLVDFGLMDVAYGSETTFRSVVPLVWDNLLSWQHTRPLQ